MIYYKYLLKYEDGTDQKVCSEIFDKMQECSSLELLFSSKISHSIWSKFIKRSFILDNNIDFPNGISYGEDLAFVYTLAMYSPSFMIIDEYLYFYYKREESLDSDVNEKTVEITKALLFIKEQLIKNNIYIKYREEFEYMAYIQGYYMRKKYIFNNKNNISRNLFNNWRKLNINTKSNKFYKKLYEKECKKVLIIDEVCKRSYMLGQLYYKVMS